MIVSIIPSHLSSSTRFLKMRIGVRTRPRLPQSDLLVLAFFRKNSSSPIQDCQGAQNPIRSSTRFLKMRIRVRTRPRLPQSDLLVLAFFRKKSPSTLCSLLIFFVANFLSHMHCFVCYSHAPDQNGHQNGHQNGGERPSRGISTVS